MIRLAAGTVLLLPLIANAKEPGLSEAGEQAEGQLTRNREASCLDPDEFPSYGKLDEAGLANVSSRLAKLLGVPGSSYEVNILFSGSDPEKKNVFRDPERRRLRVNVRLAGQKKTVGRLSFNLNADNCSINQVTFGNIEFVDDSERAGRITRLLNLNASVLTKAGPDQFLLAVVRRKADGHFVFQTGQVARAECGISQKNIHVFEADEAGHVVEWAHVPPQSGCRISIIRGDVDGHAYGFYPANANYGLMLYDGTNYVDRLAVLDQYNEVFSDIDALHVNASSPAQEGPRP